MAETPDISPIPAVPSPLESPQPEPSPAPHSVDTGAEAAPAEAMHSPGPAAPEPAAQATSGYAVAPAEGVADGELEDPLVEPTPAARETPTLIAEPAPAAPPVAAPLEVSASPAEPPGIATSVVVPPLPAGEAGEGGEWDLLLSKVRAWYDGADLQGRWESLGGPLRGAGLLLAAVVLLRLYSALLETLGDLPLVPRLLQLVGLVTVVHFGLTRLVRSSDRERILTTWQHRWNDFRGRD